MSTRPDSAALRPPRTRRSIAHVPRSRMTSGLDKENATTEIGAAQPLSNNTKPALKDKKSRSKSLGPGGLDALQNSNGNRRQSTASFPLKSILKPTVPVSPVRTIPTFEETRRRTPARSEQQTHDGTMDGQGQRGQGNEGPLIDFEATPGPPTADHDNDDTANPFDTFNATSAIREEMAATKERDEQERKDRERQNILEKRAARRKSMANRRVSFAPEATLHTWNVVEIPDDSTSSSAANSTRRASAAANSQNQPAPSSPTKDAPSSPAESEFGFSPVRTQDLDQIRGRPSSGGGDDDLQDLSSSPFSGSSVGSEDTGAQSLAGEEEDDGDSSGSDDGFDAESTAMSMDDMTARSGISVQSDATSSSSSSARLNEALRQAAKEAGTEIDEDGEISMEIADQEITGAFQPFDWGDISARHDEENLGPSKEATTQGLQESDDIGEDEDLSMDVTNAVGRILGKSPGRRQSTARRQSVAEESNYGDQTMEMTNVVGGIAQEDSPSKFSEIGNEDEGMTMEFTSAVGKILGNQPTYASNSDQMNFDQDNESDDGMDMEITGAIGGILQSGIEANDKVHAKMIMELETDSGQLASSPFQANVRQSPAKSPAKSPLAYQIAAVASETGSPSLTAVRARPSRRSSTAGPSGTPGRQRSPNPKPLTPPKQSTPQAKPTTPSKTPPSSDVTFRSASPKKLFQPELQQSADKRKSLRQSLFEHNVATGESTPVFKLQPREGRRSSGLGIDKAGLGSPRVAALLDKRQSLGDSTPPFIPQEQPRSGVRFEDPLQMQAEEERDREEEELREDGHITGLQPDRDVTSSLKDMISNLSPKKTKIGSRKSLHVGAARGVLGKRPVELDLDEDEVENSPKRLRGHNVSPVKGVKLPAPVFKEGNARRSILSPARRAASSSPPRGSTTPSQKPLSASHTSTTPLKHGIDALRIASDPQQPEEENTPVEEPPVEIEPIKLQDFLKMTNIHFMELTTTKRRHTTAPGSATKKLTRPSGENMPKPGSITFDDCVAAGFCTVPMLELYQHSCRELKSYISEGRQVIRSIEAETYAENPALFKEYVTAPPDIRVIMDNQFRNVKTHARLLSKATWYEWRMKLLEGLKEGLIRHVDEMKADDDLLSEREELLNKNVPLLVEKHDSLEQEATNLQQLVDEMENCDQDELRSTRSKLSEVDSEIATKRRELEQLQKEVQEKTTFIETGAEMRDEFLAQIQEAERVKEECRGWSAREINELKASVQRIQQQTGWSIISASTPSDAPKGPLLKMAYRDQLQLEFYPGAFASKNSDLDESKNYPMELTSQKNVNFSPIASLVLHSLQHHLTTIQQSTVAPKQLLRFISSAWDRTVGLEKEARMLEFCGVTRLTLSKPDEGSLSLRTRCTLLGNATVSTPGRKGATSTNNGAKRIDVDFTVRTRIDKTNAESTVGSLDFDIDVLATKVYGFGTGNKSGLPDKELQSILGKGLGREKDGGVQLGNGLWCKAVRTLTGSVF
ncbi:Kinetochore Spc7 [Penicillium cf. griseofulvum]|uniref:Kinetochore Spc7 n=1 Tax=Penicillium cf. griseofulvum TaxID=2972120 RepID=A0A9W9ITN0_9EURO|nr:Kinetochore Spc7 [Penicillium cf. griseofulvum]